MSDERIEEIKAIAQKTLGYVGQLNKLVQSQAKSIQDLNSRISELEDGGNQSNKFRVIRAAPEAIAFAAYLLHAKQFTLKEIEDAGALSYNRTYGLSQWSDEHLHKFLEDNKVLDHYEQGDTHSAFADFVPNYQPKQTT